MSLKNLCIGLLILGATLVGCKKEEDSPTNNPTPTECTSLTLSGSGVAESAASGSLPAPAGGTIAEGTYVLTEWKIYPPGSVDPFVRKQSIRFAGNRIEIIGQKDSGPVEKGSGTFTISGSTMNFAVTCPSNSADAWQFTATATQLLVIETDDKEVHVYTKM